MPSQTTLLSCLPGTVTGAAQALMGQMMNPVAPTIPFLGTTPLLRCQSTELRRSPSMHRSRRSPTWLPLPMRRKSFLWPSTEQVDRVEEIEVLVPGIMVDLGGPL